jgi:uncharacterized protein YecT (DUF1311 family)
MRLIFLLQTLFLLFLSNICNAQFRTHIEKIDSDYQYCLDHDPYMYGCTEKYYSLMDSMLNVIFRQIVHESPNKKNTITIEQRNWLKKRDKTFRKIDFKPNVDELNPTDYAMILLDEKSMYVHDRIIELLERYGVNSK